MTKRLIAPISGYSLLKRGGFLFPLLLAACSNSADDTALRPSVGIAPEPIVIDGTPVPTTSDQTKFASRTLGVIGSPRITKSKRVRKGGGTYKVGKPYTIRGKRYIPREDPNYSKVGLASWYGPNFHGRLTANGEIYDQYSLSAAHPTMPLPSYAKVTNLENGSFVTVRVNDRGPYAHNRIIDLSAHAARLLGYTKQGVAKVRVEYVGRARMDGLDEDVLLASYNPGSLDPSFKTRANILLAQVKQSINPTANTPRTSLQAYNQVGFAPPVPEFRPLTSNGIPISLSELNALRPAYGLVNSYVQEEHKQESAAAIERIIAEPEINAPDRGLSDLQQIRLGPFANGNRLILAENLMLKWGPTTITTAADGNSASLLTVVVKDQLPSILKQLREHNISKFEPIR